MYIYIYLFILVLREGKEWRRNSRGSCNALDTSVCRYTNLRLPGLRHLSTQTKGAPLYNSSNPPSLHPHTHNSPDFRGSV